MSEEWTCAICGGPDCWTLECLYEDAEEGSEMKTDRELLELAARAWIRSGMRLECPDDDDGIYVCRDQARNGYTWNPLTDDGDALRLAVTLEITVEHGDKTAWAYSAAGFKGNADERYGDDAMQSTRRAIVSAAAAIGESMK